MLLSKFHESRPTGPGEEDSFNIFEANENKISWKAGIFYSILRPFQDYFSSFETGQSVRGGGGENGRTPEKKQHGTPASRTWLV